MHLPRSLLTNQILNLLLREEREFSCHIRSEITAFTLRDVGLSMMCYTLGKENKTVLGEIQLRGRMGKLLYCLCQTASCLAKSSKE